MEELKNKIIEYKQKGISLETMLDELIWHHDADKIISAYKEALEEERAFQGV